MNKKNILFGKLGQIIAFDRTSPLAVRSNTNGNFEAYCFLDMLLKTGHNVFVAADNINITHEQLRNEKNLYLITDFAPKIDIGFVFMGVSEKDVSPTLVSIINSVIPWYAIVPDPRCLKPLAHLLTHPPKKIFHGTCAQSVEFIPDRRATVMAEYLNIEAANVWLEDTNTEVDPRTRHNNLVVIANETQTWDRIGRVLKMVEMLPKDRVAIYGRVSDKYKEDSRFKGEVPVQEVYAAQKLCKATYLAPITPGWITAKYLECLARGVVPIMDTSYGDNVYSFYCKVQKVDPRLFVSRPQQLYALFTDIVNDDSYYKDLIKRLRKALYPEHSKEALFKQISKLINEK